MNAIWNHFERVAPKYTARSHDLLWQPIRQRERKAVATALTSLNPQNILELGCGTGYYTSLLREIFPHAQITAVDFSVSMLNHHGVENVTKICADMCSFKSEKVFDLIFCAGALEFASASEKALATIQRCRAPQGSVVLLVPLAGLWTKVYRAYHRRHGFKLQLFDQSCFELWAQDCNLAMIQSKYVFPFSHVLMLQPRCH